MSLIDLLERVRQSEDDWQSERLGVTFWRKRLWDTFWQSVASVVMDYLWKRYHLSDDDLSDIAYESIQNLLKKLENPKLRFNSENQLLYYIRRTATNCAIDFFRKRKRKEDIFIKREEDIFIKREEEEDIFIKLRSKIADRSRAEDTILDAIEDEEFWQWVSQLDPIDQIIAEGISREDKVTKIQERINKELKLDLSYYQVYRLYNQVKDKLEQYFEQRGRRPTPARPKSPTVPTPELVEVPPDEAIAWCIVVRCMPWLSGIADHLLALLQHKNKRVITTALGTLRVPAVVEQLSEAQRQQLAQQCLQLLHHPDSGVIASSLVTLRVPAVVEQLSESQRQQIVSQCHLLLDNWDERVRASVIGTLSCFMRNQHDRLMRLVQSMRFDPSPKVQRSVCWALEQMGLATDGAG